MTTSKPTGEQLDLPMSSPPAGPAKTSAWPEKEKASTAREADSSSTLPELFATYDPESLCWRTSQRSLLGGLTEFSDSWPRSGMTVNGIAYQLPVLAHRTYVTGSGLLPTPAASDYGTQKGQSPGASYRPSLQTMARQNRWPTPTSMDGVRGVETPEAKKARGANTGTTLNDAVAQLVATPPGCQLLEGWQAQAPINRSGLRHHTEWWAAEPDVGRVANGIPDRVDRLRGLGNAIVPQVAEAIFRALDHFEAVPTPHQSCS